MSTPYSSQPLDLCRHTEYRVCCVSCSAHDCRLELAEAIAQAKSLEEIVKGYETDAAKKGLPREEYQRLEVKKKQSSEQHVGWVERSQALKVKLDSMEERVKLFCASHKPDDISEAFEMDAIEREDEIKEIWRNAAKDESKSDFISFSREDPANRAPFAGLSRTTIPATSDSLVSDGIGLQVFLKHGKNMDHRRPDRALGSEPGPAIMSYGAALEMFGEPAGPGPKPKPCLADKLTQCTIAEAKGSEGSQLPEPKTEHEARLRDSSHPLCEPLLSQDEQWALFRSNKFMADTAILARQYVKLVNERVQEEARARAEQRNIEDKKGKGKPEIDIQPDESLAAGTIGSRGPTKDGWPPVEGLDFAGFTNWIHRCKAADSKFGSKTLKSWNTTRQERRKELVARLRAWTPPKGFNDGSADHPDPKQYFPHDVSLDELDMKSMGIKR